MAELLLLQPDPRSEAVLRQALGARYHLSLAKSWQELERRADREEAIGCILDIFGTHPPVSLPAVRRFRRKNPALAVVVGSEFQGREIELYHLGRANVDGVIRMEEGPSPREIRRVVEEALASSLAETVLLRVGPELPHLAQEAIRWTIEQAASRTQVCRMAAALALTPRALHREMRRLELAPPRTLLLWGRLIRAVHSLERLGETVESIALGLGYSSGGALRKALKRNIGCSPTTLLKRGGLAWILEAFLRKGLRRARKERKRWANAGDHRWRRSTASRRPM